MCAINVPIKFKLNLPISCLTIWDDGESLVTTVPIRAILTSYAPFNQHQRLLHVQTNLPNVKFIQSTNHLLYCKWHCGPQKKAISFFFHPLSNLGNQHNDMFHLHQHVISSVVNELDSLPPFPPSCTNSCTGVGLTLHLTHFSSSPTPPINPTNQPHQHKLILTIKQTNSHHKHPI